MPDALEERLVELAADLRVDVPDGLEAAVMTRVHAARPPSRWRRWAAGLLLGLLGPGGVGVTSDDPVTGTPSVPAASGGTSLADAAAAAGFTPLVPAELGTPEGVEVSDDELVVSLSWTTEEGTVRLDQFEGGVEPLFWKTAPEASHVTVSGRAALWLPTAHRVSVVDGDGDIRHLPSRLAAPTLVWPSGDLTLRLEGDLSLEQATTIAESVDGTG